MLHRALVRDMVGGSAPGGTRRPNPRYLSLYMPLKPGINGVFWRKWRTFTFFLDLLSLLYLHWPYTNLHK